MYVGIEVELVVVVVVAMAVADKEDSMLLAEDEELSSP